MQGSEVNSTRQARQRGCRVHFPGAAVSEAQRALIIRRSYGRMDDEKLSTADWYFLAKSGRGKHADRKLSPACQYLHVRGSPVLDLEAAC